MKILCRFVESAVHRKKLTVKKKHVWKQPMKAE